ncbi:hypothetical protein T552_01965 [Pneumocystis carinii B80]|uniref:NAA35-like TPR repeats domain-containing protein n=1 Tax=Pneumocystis carinii (strain B80) TaxID=1408658 RepID=A0A0W4ZIB0_PNEC8|nr:hypothetical protein T552_01965 [Pneumocystis carinii B80]KTW28104.1 hypothetical protein T552_01965 [Pneumocystis carinii B80]
MYKQRFKSFLFLKTPEFLNHETFIKDSDMSDTLIVELLKILIDNFSKAKTIFEIIKNTDPKISSMLLCYDDFQNNVKNIVELCLKNKLTCEIILEKALKSDNICNDVSINIKYNHSWFPVIIVCQNNETLL